MSQSIQSKYLINNSNKTVSIPFTDVYVWSNYFVRYEFLHNSNSELNQIVTRQFQIDSSSKINHKLIYDNFIRITKQDSIQKEILLKKITERDVKIDTLKSEKNVEINKNFVTTNVTLPLEKQKSFNSGKTRGIIVGGLYGTVIGAVLIVVIKIFL